MRIGLKWFLIGSAVLAAAIGLAKRYYDDQQWLAAPAAAGGRASFNNAEYLRWEAEQRAKEMLGRVGLPEKVRDRPGKLSGGQQQRVAIARALVHGPSLLVADEPTSALDSENGQRVMQLLRDVAREHGRTVIVVTHDPRIYRYADRMAEMEDGRIFRVLNTPAEIAAAHQNN